MTIIEQIHQMPLHEKLLTMEALWDDIARNDNDIEVSDWHKQVLDQREHLIAEGKAHFIDWNQAKQEIWLATR
jgi:hypothetical protein